MDLSRNQRMGLGFGVCAAVTVGAAWHSASPADREAISEVAAEYNPWAEKPVPQTTANPTTTLEQPSDCQDIRTLSTAQQAGAVMIVIGEANQLDTLRDTMQRNFIGSFALSNHSESIADSVSYRGQPTPFAQAITDIKSAVSETVGPVTFASDEEGGIVQRLSPLSAVSDFPSAAEQALMPEEQLRNQAQQRAQELASVGVDMVLGPVLDVGQVTPSGEKSFINTRSYGDTPATVAAKASILIEALDSAGIETVGKHYPDHGAVAIDTHTEVGQSLDLSILAASGALPAYQQLFDEGSLDHVMINHLEVPGLTDAKQPASLSPAVYNLLDSQGFEGVAMTDALAMEGAINGINAENPEAREAQAAVLALQAGADQVLVNLSAADTTHQAIMQAVDDGSLPDFELAQKAANVWVHNPKPVDICGY